MQPLKTLTSVAVPLDVANIDTDQLIPARFMSRPRSEGYGAFLLRDLRWDSQGKERPDNPLKNPVFRDAAILVAGRNFGTGSSREAAVYALWDAGFRCVIAPSFGDIFAANAIKNGLLPAKVAEEDERMLVAFLRANPAEVVTIRVEEQAILWADGTARFEISPSAKQQLLNGWDDIDRAMQFTEDIRVWSHADRLRRPWAIPSSPNAS